MEPATGLRERKKLRTRDAIVAAALDLFAERGYDATTVEMIADAADVSPATVFRYFAAKEEIVFSDRDRRLPQLAAAIAARPACEPDLVAAGRALEEVFADPGTDHRVRLQQRAIAASAVLRGKAADVLADWEDAIREALVTHRPLDRSDPDGRVRAALVIAGLRVALEAWLASSDQDLVRSIDRTFRRVEDVARTWIQTGGSPW